MLSFGALSFAAPWALIALAVLPVLWWLLRVLPPAPQLVRFPAIRLVMRLVNPEESSAKTPLWLIILRTLLVILAILAAAHPLLNAAAKLGGDGPLILVVDDGWAAAGNWRSRQTVMANLIDLAERENRAVAVIATAPESGALAGAGNALLSPGDAREVAGAIKPKPWPVNRPAVLAVIEDLEIRGDARIVWLSDGLDNGDAEEFAARLQALGDLTVLGDAPGDLAILLMPPTPGREGLKLRAVRPAGDGNQSIRVQGRDEDGRLLVRQTLTFEAGKRSAEAQLALPVELRNRLTRLEIEGQQTAGAVVLVDERWRRRPVGLVSGPGRKIDQPYLDEIYYLDRALDPFTEVRTAALGELMKRELAMLVIPDSGPLADRERKQIAAWMDAGGVAVRFAGPRLATQPDDLLPVRLRKGNRELGGALSWTKPAELAPFADTSPFNGIAVPKDVKIRRQVLAQPSLDLPAKTWARLSDGTPLVTAEKRGRGWLVLIHTTASPSWSNLPLSGLFVGMLQRLVALGRGVAAKEGRGLLPPLQSIGGFGELLPPLPGALAIPGPSFEKTKPGPKHPPGFYGDQAARRALNLSAGFPPKAPISAIAPEIIGEAYQTARETDLRPWFLTIALLLALADLVASLALRGFFVLARAAAVVLLLATAATPVYAQSIGVSPSDKAMAAAVKLRLGYIMTGRSEIDNISRAGLTGLAFIANSRTAAELAEPVAVDPEVDELAFYPLLYWPVIEDGPDFSAAALERLNIYLRRGGTILFDTREQGGAASAGDRLRRLARHLDIPPLVAIPSDHVLARSYYLLREFPGRWNGGRLWVERRGARVNDGVSSVIVGSNDWAAAWAVDDARRPMFPVVPGGERQREMAYRFGINLVMYVLTGNYKSDQVHLPAILERLGQ